MDHVWDAFLLQPNVVYMGVQTHQLAAIIPEQHVMMEVVIGTVMIQELETITMVVTVAGIRIATIALLVITMKILLDQVNVHGVVLISMQEIIMLVVINAGT